MKEQEIKDEIKQFSDELANNNEFHNFHNKRLEFLEQKKSTPNFVAVYWDLWLNSVQDRKNMKISEQIFSIHNLHANKELVPRHFYRLDSEQHTLMHNLLSDSWRIYHVIMQKALKIFNEAEDNNIPIATVDKWFLEAQTNRFLRNKEFQETEIKQAIHNLIHEMTNDEKFNSFHQVRKTVLLNMKDNGNFVTQYWNLWLNSVQDRTQIKVSERIKSLRKLCDDQSIWLGHFQFLADDLRKLMHTLIKNTHAAYAPFITKAWHIFLTAEKYSIPNNDVDNWFLEAERQSHNNSYATNIKPTADIIFSEPLNTPERYEEIFLNDPELNTCEPPAPEDCKPRDAALDDLALTPLPTMNKGENKFSDENQPPAWNVTIPPPPDTCAPNTPNLYYKF